MKKLIILNYCPTEIIQINLSEEQIKEMNSYDNHEDYINTLEEKYNFNLRHCYWMVTDELTKRTYSGTLLINQNN